MNYKKYDVPLSAGIVVNDGNAYLGVEFLKDRGHFAIYDFKTKKAKRFGDNNKINLEDVVGLDELCVPYAVSDKDAYFFVSKKFDWEEYELVGYSLEVYDKNSLKKRASIDACTIENDWLENFEIIEAAKLSATKYLVAYYDNREIMSCKLKVCIYDLGKRAAETIGEMNFEYEIFDVSYKTENKELVIKSKGAINPVSLFWNEWSEITLRLSNDFRRLEQTGEMVKKTSGQRNLNTSSNMIDITYPMGIKYEFKNKGLFGSDYISLKNLYSNTEFYSKKIGRNLISNVVISEHLEVVIVEENDYKKEEDKVLIFEKSLDEFNLTESIIKNNCRIIYDMEKETILIQDFHSTSIITKEE